MSTTITVAQSHVKQLDALWTIFQSQNKSVRKAFTQRLLSEVLPTKKNSKTKPTNKVKLLDEMLYGAIQLPADFDYEEEIKKVDFIAYSNIQVLTPSEFVEKNI